MNRQTRFWAVRVDHWAAGKMLWDELRSGRLRQGWGYAEEQDLRTIAEALERGEALTKAQQETWRGNRRLLASQGDAVQQGDLVLIPHLPSYGAWSLVRVTGAYRFERVEGTDDYRHVLPVELVSGARPINPYEPASSANLRRAMKARQRMWSLDRFHHELDELVEALQQPGPPPAPVSAPLKHVLGAARAAIWAQLSRHFEGASFEKPCVELLEAIYETVEHTGGPNERGADALCTYLDPLGIEQHVAVQIKMWDGEADDVRPLQQLKRARDEHDLVTAGLVLSTAKTMSAAFESARSEMEKNLRIPIRVVLRDDLLDLFLKYLPELGVGSEEDTASANG